MDPIRVPAPPKTAFNKQRPMSDLIKWQVRHFKHLEQKLPPESRAALPQHHIITEADAARYIAPMTALLRSRSRIAAIPAAAKTVAEMPLPSRRAKGLSIAATADTATPVRKAKKKPSTKQNSRKRPSKRTK
jgi:hypothetical protein